ncbi:ABC transporter permease [Xaviernesmea oryzae]|uniref:ABC transporter permease n=1 Tax=Xaviernesmea oryzae TaxID=464029 RepID=A0A1Q9AQS6_9HYPH|nr:ABC transporter permease [Xaviernesmea oryzae]OLP57787.1 ABC transporter permease [Xaviernesmea oryzae]SEL37048.1 ribose transport system permease protein [Xaviernesmea oryzae]
MLVDTALLVPASARADTPSPQKTTVSQGLAGIALRGGALAVFVTVFVLFAFASPIFLTPFNLGNILAQSAISGVLAIGLTVVIIAGGGNVVSGGIDLSLAANMGLSAAVYAALSQAGQVDGVAVLAALGTGLAIGAVNALAVTWARIVPLLATLAVMNVVGGLELVLTQNTVIPAITPLLESLSGSGPFGIPALAYVLLGFALITAVVVQATPLGLRLYAVGEFPEAARASGLALKRFIAGSFLFSGLSGGIAGILSAAYLSGSTTGAGELLLPVVVTALLGQVFSRRLVPTITGTLLSALFVGVLINGFQLLNLSSTLVSGIQGLLILLVVSATTLLRPKEG